jgi:hypothetical protein
VGEHGLRLERHHGLTGPGDDDSAHEVESGAEASTGASAGGTGSGGGDETTGDGTSTAPGETGSSNTTTVEPDPVCGDGVVDPKSEECDDGLADPRGRLLAVCRRSAPDLRHQHPHQRQDERTAGGRVL